jgi:hypothetical protein
MSEDILENIEINTCNNVIKLLKEDVCNDLLIDNYDMTKINYKLNIIKQIENEEYMCNICKEEDKNKIFIITECYHIFCLYCIFKTLEINNNCPNCRTNNFCINNFYFFSNELINNIKIPVYKYVYNDENQINNNSELINDDIKNDDEIINDLLSDNNIVNRLDIITNNILFSNQINDFEQKLNIINDQVRELLEYIDENLNRVNIEDSIILLIIKTKIMFIKNNL